MKRLIAAIVLLGIATVAVLAATVPYTFVFQSAAPITIGETAILTGGDGGNANFILAQQATLGQNATLNSLSFYVTTAAGNLILGLYDASGSAGGPGKLLAQTGSFAATTGWNTKTTNSQPALAAGNYWLAYMPSSNSLAFVKQNTSGNCYYGSLAFSSGMPATWPSTAGSGCTPTTWSFYATLTPSAPPPVNGSCGTANGVAVNTAPTANLCSAGTSTTVTGSGPWSWTCVGSNGGSTASCSAPLAPPVNGACGSANGGSFSSAPTTNLCSAGTASALSGSGPWTWTCNGGVGGTSAMCSAQLGTTPPPPGVTFTPLHQYYLGPP